MGDIIIRKRTSGDLSQAAEVLTAVHAVDGYPVEGVENPIAWLAAPGLLTAWVALREERIVGHVSVGEPRGEGAVALWTARSDNTEDEIAVLGRLFVHPDARGAALGERLTRTAMKWAAETGRRLVLDVMEKDQGAIRLYERLGWTEFGRITHQVPRSSADVPARCYVSPHL